MNCTCGAVMRREVNERPNERDYTTPRAVLPMRLRVGERLVSESGEWVVTGRPFPTAGGKTAHARVNKVDQPEVTEIRSWGAHDRVTVQRTGGG